MTEESGYYDEDDIGRVIDGIEDDAEDVTSQSAAVERVVETARIVNLGELPERGAWEQMCRMAVTFAESDLVPKAMYRKPADVLLVLVTAHDLGIGVTNALSQCYVIDSKVTISPKLRLALLNNSGRGTIRPHKDNTAESATAIVFDSDRRTVIGEYTLDVGDVPPALLGKTNWKNYPKRMLWWRCLGYAIDDYFPEAGIGLYSADELGAVTDEDGEPIGLDSYGPEPGFERRVRAERPTDPKIDEETLASLNALRAAISECEDKDLVGEVRLRWTAEFAKQASASFTMGQGRRAIAMLRPFVQRIADAEDAIEEIEVVSDDERPY